MIAARVNRLWRLLMTALCFTLFGLGGLLLSLLWFNLLLLVVRDNNKRRRLARRTISASFRAFLAFAGMTGVLRYRVQGADILHQAHGCLVVANHPTLIDYVLLASVMPETDCLVKSALLKNPFLRGVIRAADYQINSEADVLLTQSQARLQHGDTLVIFPEGTRTRPGEKMTLQRGAANIAVRCRRDIQLVTLRCSEHLLGKQNPWYHIPPAIPQFDVIVGERIYIEDFLDASSQEPTLAARALNRHLLKKLQFVEDPNS